MKTKISIVLFLLSFSLFAQKKTEKTWSADKIETIVINGNGVFKIKVTNSPNNTISLQVKIEGEYAEHLVLIDSISNKSLMISTAFQPLFKSDNDKLSAHKVLSTEFEISVPKHISLDIKSDIASVQISGVFPSVLIELQQGNCSLKPFFGNATVNTIEGNITIVTNNAAIEAFTKTGIKEIYQFKYEQHHFNLHSINGNIKVSKTEN